MATDLNNIPKNFILSSPESIRKKILDRLVDYEELNGVDLSKTQFFSYMIDVMSMLSSDNANSLSLSKKESYLITANLPSSVYNWSSYLSYKKDFAKPAEVDCLLSIPLAFTSDIIFKIDYFTKFKADKIIFTNPEEYFTFKYDHITKVLAGTAVNENTVRNLKIIIQDDIAYTVIPLKQLEKTEEEVYIPYDLQIYQPYYFTMSYDNKISDIKLFIKEDEQGLEEEWERVDNYFEMGLNEKKFHFKYENANTVRIMFGNDIFGRQPTPGSKVHVIIYNTKADKGSIIPAAITKMDRIFYTTQSGITTQISITPTNVGASSQGVSDETLEDTSRKAIARFKARKRLVGEDDFNNIKDIIESGLPYSHAKSILKRSDIKTNEVVLYAVLPKEYKSYQPQTLLNSDDVDSSIYLTIPIPTTSLVGTIADSINDVTPYTTFNDGSNDWICPFGMVKETSSYVYYYYAVNDVNTSPDAFVYDQITFPISFTNLNFKSDVTFDNMTFTLDYFNLNNTVDMNDVSVKLYLRFKSDLKGPYTPAIDIGNSQFTYTVPMIDIKAEPCVIEYHINQTSTGTIIAKVKSNYFLKRNLKNYMYSTAVTGGGITTIYDIPCILKSYYDDLTSVEQSQFEADILQKIIAASNFSDYRMMNFSINLKFVKTYGIGVNYSINDTTRADVIDIQNDPPASPAGGDRYIIGPEPTGIWIGHETQIALFGTSWVYLDAAPGDIIYVTNKTAKYTFSGNAKKWLIPTFELPFKIDVYVYINSLADNDSVIIEAVKQQLMYVLTAYSGIDREQHRSIMYRAIQELGSYIDHCEIVMPEVDLTFNYNIDNFSQIQLKTYVPEYIYCVYENIQVKLIRV